MPGLHFVPFFQTFSCVPTVFPEFPSCNVLIFPTVSSVSLVFPSLPFIFSASLMFFSQLSSIFLHFPPVFNDFPSFSLVFSYLFPSVFRGPRENRTPPSPNCLVAHAPLKDATWPPLSPPDIEISVHLGNLPPAHPYTHFVRENNFA